MLYPIIAGIIALAIIIPLIIYVITVVNRLIALRNRMQASFADVDVQLKRRHDLIPVLVDLVKAYAKHEQQVFTEVAEKRTRAMRSKEINQKIKSEEDLEGGLKTLFAVVENYPDLKAHENYRQLMQTLADIENQLAYAKRYYNAVVRDYEIQRTSWPQAAVTGIFWFLPGRYYGQEK